MKELLYGKWRGVRPDTLRFSRERTSCDPPRGRDCSVRIDPMLARPEGCSKPSDHSGTRWPCLPRFAWLRGPAITEIDLIDLRGGSGLTCSRPPTLPDGVAMEMRPQSDLLVGELARVHRARPPARGRR